MATNLKSAMTYIGKIETLHFCTRRANVLQLTLIATWYGICYEKAFLTRPMDFVSD